MPSFSLPPRIALDGTITGATAGGGARGAPAAGRERGLSKKGCPWSEEEHVAFLQGLQQVGKGKWKDIARHFVPSRTPTQVASHAQKHFMRVSGKLRRRSRFTSIEAQQAQMRGMGSRRLDDSTVLPSSSSQPAAAMACWAPTAASLPPVTVGVPLGMPVYHQAAYSGPEGGGGAPVQCATGHVVMPYAYSYGILPPAAAASQVGGGGERPSCSGTSQNSATTSDPSQLGRVCRPTACPASRSQEGLAKLRESLFSGQHQQQPLQQQCEEQQPAAHFRPSTHSAFSPAAVTTA